MIKTYYCVSLIEDQVLNEWPKHEFLEDAKRELEKSYDPVSLKIYKVTYEIEEINA